MKDAAMKDAAVLTRLRGHISSPLFRNGYALTVSSGVTSVLGMAYWLLAARFYSAEVVGANSAAIAAMTFLAGLAGLYMDGVFVRYIPQLGRPALRLVRTGYALSLAVAVAVGSIFLAGLNVWSPALGFLRQEPWLAAWFVLGVASWTVFVEQDGLLTGLRRTTWVPVENALYAVFKLVLLAVFASLVPAYGIFASWTLPAVVLILPVNWAIFTRLLPAHVRARPQGNRIAPREVMAYAGSNYAGYLLGLAYTTLPPLLVVQQVGTAAGAYFYLPWVIGGLLRLVASNMGTSLIVEGSLNRLDAHEYFQSALVHTLRLVAPVAVLVALAAPWLLRLFGPAYAAEGTTLLRLLAVATIPSSYVSLRMGLLRTCNRVRPVVAVYAVTAVLVLGLSYGLLPRWGISGVGVAWLVSQCVAAAVLWRLDAN